ncbi:MAG: hypothetical protein RL318_851 [Fibrobacterota bacterium]|jgi:Mg-chelatase subunit ChlD
MPDANLSHIVFVLDRSGSMDIMRREAVDGFNRFLAHQGSLPGRVTTSLVQFSDKVETSWENIPLSEASLTLEGYCPGGMTALFDAVGSTVDAVGRSLAKLPETRRPAKVLFAILTDGEENSSRHYDAARVQERIRHQADVYGWEFLFLGASERWLEQAKELGIESPEDAICFTPDPDGMTLAMCEASESIGRRRRK